MHIAVLEDHHFMLAEGILKRYFKRERERGGEAKNEEEKERYRYIKRVWISVTIVDLILTLYLDLIHTYVH